MYVIIRTRSMTCQLCKKKIHMRIRVSLFVLRVHQINYKSIITDSVLPFLILNSPEPAFSFRRCTRAFGSGPDDTYVYNCDIYVYPFLEYVASRMLFIIDVHNYVFFAVNMLFTCFLHVAIQYSARYVYHRTGLWVCSFRVTWDPRLTETGPLTS